MARSSSSASGIQLGLQLTAEARDEIELADDVLRVVTDPVAATWLESLNRNARSLTSLYRAGVPRRRIYPKEMVEEILGPCARQARLPIFYGHPGVATSSPARGGAARAKRGSRRMLPAVSAEDCLVADLGVDPGERGWRN